MDFDNRPPKQETEEARAYRAFKSHIKRQLTKSGRPGVDLAADPELAELVETNASLCEIRSMAPGSVHHDEVLQQLAVMYSNDELVGDRLMPTIFTNGALSGIYFTYNKRDKFGFPDDDMTDRSDPNELNQGRSKQAYGLTPRGLSEYLDVLTLNNQSAPLNELMDLQENVQYAMAFKREQRILTAVTTSGNYGGNVTALTGADRWDVGTSDPGAVVDAAMEATWPGNGPGRKVAVTSLAVHNKLKRHPRILDTFKFATGAQGPSFATRQMLAAYFEVDEYLVAAARQDTANEGQTASYSRMMPNSFAVLRVAPPNPRNASFGFVFQDNPPDSQLFFMPEKGTRGAYKMKVGMCDSEHVVAGDTSLLITDCIS
jgi:hypothetical protein